ncbi:MAG: sensor histidine kinase, partial [Verrucomicrobiota bacterium]|nr:sensor histidine kinase [Verrucomicrobiota bacterium]
WWTARRLAVAAGVQLLAATAAFTWAALLRRRVRQQTSVIAQKVKTEAALEERQRIAREFHDTLEQELVGLALRLDAAVPKVYDEKPRELLEGARRLVQQLQAGARGFLWNLRDHTFDGATLAEAIAHATADQQPGRSVEVRTTGTPRRLPGVVEHELLRIAQEAVTNAVKHGRASAISLVLEYATGHLRFTVTDNGSGFDPARDGIKPGHFGLIGMRERVKKLGGAFELRSRRDEGATIDITVPAPP